MMPYGTPYRVYLVYTWSCAFHIVVMTISLCHNFQNWKCIQCMRFYVRFDIRIFWIFVCENTYIHRTSYMCGYAFKYVMCLRDVEEYEENEFEVAWWKKKRHNQFYELEIRWISVTCYYYWIMLKYFEWIPFEKLKCLEVMNLANITKMEISFYDQNTNCIVSIEIRIKKPHGLEFSFKNVLVEQWFLMSMLSFSPFGGLTKIEDSNNYSNFIRKSFRNS